MENKFEIGDLVRIKSGLTEDETGVQTLHVETANNSYIITLD